MWKILGLAGLVALGSMGCVGSASESADESEGAVSGAAEVRSVNGKALRYAFFPLAFEAPIHAFAGLAPGKSPGTDIEVTTTLFGLAASDYTLTVEGTDGNVEDVPVEVPTNTVKGATPRLELFVVRDDAVKMITAEDSGINLFEKVTVAGDVVTYEAVLSDGERVNGRIEMPGLTSGETRYAFAAIPRDVKRGSIFGTHFFRVGVACKTAGCADGPELPEL